MNQLKNTLKMSSRLTRIFRILVVIFFSLFISHFFLKEYLDETSSRITNESSILQNEISNILLTKNIDHRNIKFLKIIDRKKIITTKPIVIYGNYIYEIEISNNSELLYVNWRMTDGGVPIIQKIEKNKNGERIIIYQI